MTAEFRGQNRLDKIYRRDGGVCKICGKQVGSDATVDHIIPTSKGGVNAPWNLQLACRQCNETKADKIPDDVRTRRLRNRCAGARRKRRRTIEKRKVKKARASFGFVDPHA